MNFINEFTFMAAKKLNRVNKMGMEGCGPSHPRSSNASFDPINYSCASFEIAAIDVRLKEVVVVICMAQRLMIRNGRQLVKVI